MEIIVGTYEQMLLGYKFKEQNGNYVLELSFTKQPHVGYVKCLAVSSNGVLASGSADESIRLFHLKKRVETGVLLFHEESVNCLEFFDSSHLFSGSEDGKIAIWETTSWERQKILKGHKEPVYSFAVHPTGKLGLSVGKDKTLHTWNLIQGRRGFVINLKQVAQSVMWSPDGDKFIVVFDNSLDIYVTKTANVVHQIVPGFKISSFTFITPCVLAVSGAGGTVKFYNIEDGKLISELKTNTVRVKSMVTASGTDPSDVYLVTASTDGFIKVFRVSVSDNLISTSFLAEVQTEHRILCAVAYAEDQTDSGLLSQSPESESLEYGSATMADKDSDSDEERKMKKMAAKLKKKKKLEKRRKKATLYSEMEVKDEREKEESMTVEKKSVFKKLKKKKVLKKDQEDMKLKKTKAKKGRIEAKQKKNKVMKDKRKQKKFKNQ